jgi:predicted ATPase
MINRVIAKNYRSLAKVVVDMAPLVILVGPNGAGKSNFIDALRFVTDALSTTVATALKQRGGIDAVRRHSIGHPRNFGLSLTLQLDEERTANYAFEVRAMAEGAFAVKRERCRIYHGGLVEHQYEIQEGEFRVKVEGMRPRIAKDRLGLTALSAAEEFRPVYDALTDMRFYALVPEHIRDLQEPDPGRLLKPDGSNAAAVLRTLQNDRPEIHERICRLLSKVVPGTKSVEPISVGSKDTLQFRQDVGDRRPWKFSALSMSDGTLRALGVLLALYQQPPPTMVAIEEPESTIHPAAVEVLVDIFKASSKQTQLLIATHSPDILDDKEITDREIRAVELENGKTTISTLDHTSREAIRQRLYSPGELMRIGELRPNREVDEKGPHVGLFSEEVAG